VTHKPITYVAIVDDDESVCRSFGRLLRTVGYQTVAYPSAEAFLEDRKRPHFDCLLLDLQLEGVSGVELCHRLHAVNDPTPIVFITAQDDTDARAMTASCGCAGHFRKTDPSSNILGLIEKLLNRTSPPKPIQASKS
jgi:FixJ family two-component response regulator